ncbi:MAG: GH1 family beta-glucosidase [Pseudomonadota bacterium]
MSFDFTRHDFPDGFLFGTATAAYQIEGSSHGNCGPSHWDTWSAVAGNVANADNGAVACDSYHRWEEDLDLIKAGGFDAYRFSTSWARTMPDGVTVNQEGLDYYDRLVDGIVARGLKPNLTLYHWDLPAALADTGGWMNRDTALRFVEHTQAVIDRIGDRVEMVATINEPFCVAWLGHFVGVHAPGLRDIRGAARALHHILLAHGLSMQAMRELGQDNLGIVLNLTHVMPATNSAADAAATQRADAINNRWFLDGVLKGAYPEDMLSALAPHMPAGFEADMGTVSAPLDWLGINYYTRTLGADDPGAPWPALRDVSGPLPKTDMGWEIFPDGLEILLKRVNREYTQGRIPLIVTENGMANDDTLRGGACNDAARVNYIRDHLNAVRRTINAGVPVRGYFAWSLLDNYEWAFGYDKRFGIVHVDYDTLARTPKASFDAFRSALARNT